MKTGFLGLTTLLLLVATACSAAAPGAAATVPPTPIPATTTAVPLYQQVTLTSVPFEEDGTAPAYKITAQTPSLTGSTDARVQVFNQEAGALVQSMIADYKQKQAQLPAVPLKATSTFDVQYQLVSPAGNIQSLKFETEGYVAGMAHPYHLSYSLNYDLQQGRDLGLGDLFLLNSNYLEVLSKYCSAELSTRPIDFQNFSQGADPTAGNYKIWNITADGLLITFDEYQVAAYAAGPQTVTIPYTQLKGLLDPHGPLAGLTK